MVLDFGFEVGVVDSNPFFRAWNRLGSLKTLKFGDGQFMESWSKKSNPNPR
jgi:hypothetical protein